jgi:hypothetical protein
VPEQRHLPHARQQGREHGQQGDQLDRRLPALPIPDRHAASLAGAASAN